MDGWIIIYEFSILIYCISNYLESGMKNSTFVISILFNKLNKDEQFHKQYKYMSQLEERNKIAQEIHDNIGHTLSGGIMQLEGAKLLLDIDLPKSKSMVQSTINVLREGMDNIRITLKNIKPPFQSKIVLLKEK
ncbi:histidine kinase dimerization/phosphoacceptor domain-containing protein [Clostridium estertheticum]|uniref:histidine kinase dimerization/phosphoacceptor domain-containing protein n=1 Tax=Clostridium estertheticum TaxID=238834 RepID=UPI0013E934AB|nr:histidine kinase dimerization/phosphoacceptor domain-containing protein [Clostridium estertheticum]